ncbi:MAG: YybH family protein [Gemmatimonadota bacterium]
MFLPGLMLLLVAGPSAAQVIPGGSARDYQKRHDRRQMEFRGAVLRETTDVMQRWQNAWTSDAIRAVTRLYTEDAVLVPADGSPVVRGRQEIAAYLKRVLPKLGEITTSFQDFDVGGSLAFAMGSFSYVAPGRSVGTRRLKGQFVAVFRLESGHWRIRSQVFEQRT